MATRESNIIMFPQPIDPERKEDVRIAEQFLEKIDGLIMKGLRGAGGVRAIPRQGAAP